MSSSLLTGSVVSDGTDEAGAGDGGGGGGLHGGPAGYPEMQSGKIQFQEAKQQIDISVFLLFPDIREIRKLNSISTKENFKVLPKQVEGKRKYYEINHWK